MFIIGACSLVLLVVEGVVGDLTCWGAIVVVASIGATAGLADYNTSQTVAEPCEPLPARKGAGAFQSCCFARISAVCACLRVCR